jgi:hypothetical protein
MAIMLFNQLLVSGVDERRVMGAGGDSCYA